MTARRPFVSARRTRSAPSALLLLAMVCPALVASQKAPTASDLLDVYAAGRFDQAVGLVLAPGAPSIDALRHELEKRAPIWAAAAGPEHLAQRRLIAASFTLDVARGAYIEFQHANGLGPDQAFWVYGAQFAVPEAVRQAPWPALNALVEWACGWLRSQPVSSPLERNWFLASVQLFRDFRDSSVSRTIVPGNRNDYGRFMGHLGHAAWRFRDEPWFRVVSAERQARPEGALVWRQNLSSRNEGAWNDLQEMQRVLTPLAKDESVRAEVNVHLGCIAILCGEHDRARADLADIDPWTSNACFRYLGHYLTGWVDERDDRHADAERAYADAAMILPDAQSALMSLGGLLVEDGDRVRAARLAAQALAAPRSSVDPWVELYDGGACTRWSEFMAPLHEGILQWAGH